MISSPGLGSGLDVNGIVNQLMSIEQRPLALLNNKEAKQQAQISAYGNLKSALSSFQNSAKSLSNLSLFNGVSAKIGDTTLASVSASSTAATGNHQIEVQNLAEAQKIKSESFPATSTVIGSGTLTITFGTYNGDGTFTNNPAKTSKTITIEPDETDLASVRDAINEAGVGITASIVNDGSGNRLVIASNDTGINNAVKITVTDDDGNNLDNVGLSKLAYDASTGGIANMTQTVAARNATIVVDGITISKSSNTITDALEGVTINLLKSAPGTPTNLSISQDSSKIQAAISAFVGAYNDLVKTINDVSRYNADSKQASVLTGDATVRSVQTQIRGVLNSFLPDAPSGLNSLSQIGINFQKDGTLQLDSTKLNAVISDPNKDIASLFTTNGFAVKLDKLVDGMLKSNGLIDGRVDGINDSIRDLGRQRESLSRRLEDVEKRFRAQFTSLDTMIASMTQTSTFLQQQLSNLPKAS